MNSSEIIFYTSPTGQIKVEVILHDETVWLTQKALGELFGVETNTINYHLKEIFKSEELEENSVIRKIRITASDGKKHLTNFYNLDAIISVGYRVNSQKATHFRIWATKLFYKTVQNKLHWAITGLTAAEIISKRVNAELPNMGLTTWKKSPKGKIQKSFLCVALSFFVALCETVI